MHPLPWKVFNFSTSETVSGGFWDPATLMQEGAVAYPGGGGSAQDARAPPLASEAYN